MKDLLRVIAAITPLTDVRITEGENLYFKSVKSGVYYHVSVYKNVFRLSVGGSIMGEYETPTALAAYFIPEKSPEFGIASRINADEL